MTEPRQPTFLLENLEARIAPAGLALSDKNMLAAPVASSLLVKAGQGLSTSDAGGSYLLYVEKGQAVVFTTDLNANNKVDFNEITGIAAGDGLRLISFVDINGDIVTNLTSDGRLTDSDGTAANGYDGKVVLNNRIDSIVLRSLNQADLDSSIAGNTVANRIAKSTYSINGNIFAGAGIGPSNGLGIEINTFGFAAQEAKYGGPLTISGEGTPAPSVGFIFTGSATSGEYFSFGTAPVYGDGPAQSLRGKLTPFLPAAGQAGGDVNGVRAYGSATTDPATGLTTYTKVDFHLGGIVTGDGGFGARGGDIRSVVIHGDIGGLLLQTGNGGDGPTGGNGGSIANLSMDSSINSQVQIITGNGGDGLIGTAGLAGNVNSNGEVNVFGRITVGLGKGGDAFGNAGVGTSISSATFKSIDPGIFEPAGIVTTWRSAGDIGDQRLVTPGNPADGYVTNQIDFDGDGFYDSAVITDNPNQLFITFGTAAGAFDTGKIHFLPSPSYANPDIRTSAVVVMDANGDGKPDIVTGQSTGDGFSGLLTYINKGNDPVSGAWLGFAIPRYSPLPGGDGGLLWQSFARDTPQAIINLAAGDFDRDGTMDVGVVSMVRTPVEPDAATRAFTYSAMGAIMSGLKGGDNVADGYFAVNYGKGAGDQATRNPALHFGRGDEADFSYVLKASASEAGKPLTDQAAIISKGGLGNPSPTGLFDKGKDFVTFSLTQTALYPSGQLTDVVAPALDTTGARVTSGLLYSERAYFGDPLVFKGYGKNYKIRAADFVFSDVDLDGVFDAIVVGRAVDDGATPYLVAATLKGQASGAIVQLQQTDTANFPAPGKGYFGIALTEFRSTELQIPSVLSENYQDIPILRMISGDFDNDPETTNFALSGINLLNRNNPPRPETGGFSVTGFGQYGSTNSSTDDEFKYLNTVSISAYSVFGDTDTAFHTSFFGYFTTQNGYTAGFKNALSPVSTYYVIEPAAPTTGKNELLPIAATTLSMAAGSGGWSLLGAGGAGGAVGVSGVFSVLSSAISTTGYTETSFQSGSGGFGFLSGGRSGSISSVNSTVVTEKLAPVSVSMGTLDAGGSLLGAGGSAGQISQFMARVNLIGRPDYETPGVFLFSGNGGDGVTGGTGGAILGRNDLNFADVQSHRSQQDIGDSLAIKAGSGGFGINSGGAGGAVSRLVPEFGGGYFLALAGSGGDSSNGAGGAGGSLLVTPSPLLSRINNSPVEMRAGDGGSGLSGGQGGSVVGFIYRPTNPVSPLSSRLIAGNGGDAVTGSGGAGGAVTNYALTAASTSDIGASLAGRGGMSAAGVGGAGGTLSGATFSSQAGALAAIAGAGGDGLRAGGPGGSIGNVEYQAGGLTNARVLSIAGAGGDGYGVSLATVQKEANFAVFSAIYQTNILALGSSSATGGNGGSISNFTQPAALQASVDLIAGNGGSTINYGLISDKQTGVGRGGSMTNINLANNAGLMDPNIPIRSYPVNLTQDLRDLGAQKIVFGNLGNQGDSELDSIGTTITSTKWLAQGFRTPDDPLDRIPKLGSVSLALALTSQTAPSDVKVEVFTSSNGSPGTLLASKSSTVSSIDPDVFTFEFASTLELQENSFYWLVVSDPDGGDSFEWVYNESNSIPEEQNRSGYAWPASVNPPSPGTLSSLDSGATWVNKSSSSDRTTGFYLTSAGIEITPETGNVGVVVGAAGRVRNDLPVSGGVAGSVSGFKAQNIMSMVAGSVDRIAAITSVSGLQLQNGGTEIGAIKNSYIDPNDGLVKAFANPAARPFDTTYWAPPSNAGVYGFSGVALSGGALLDGAVVTRSYSGPATDRQFPG